MRRLKVSRSEREVRRQEGGQPPDHRQQQSRDPDSGIALDIRRRL